MLLSFGHSLSANDSRWSLYLSGGTGKYEYELPADTSGLTSLFFFSGFGTSSDPAAAQSFQNFQTYTILNSITPTQVEVKETHFRFGAEYLATEGKYLGIRFGLSGASGKETCKSGCGELGSLATLEFFNFISAGSTSAATSLLAPLIIGSLALSPQELKNEYLTLDFGLDGHFRPDEFIDPYLGFNMGVGTCKLEGLDGGSCYALKIGPRAGIRMNFADSFYAFVEGEYNSLTLQYSNTDTGSYKQEGTPFVILAGLAVRL